MNGVDPQKTFVPHTIVLGACQDCILVLADPEEAWCGNSTCTPSWTVECPGVEAGGCRAWFGCRTCKKEGVSTVYDDLGDDGMAHGVQHQWIAGVWMIPTDLCLIQVSDNTADAVNDLVIDKDLTVGRHEVLPDFDEDDIRFEVVT